MLTLGRGLFLQIFKSAATAPETQFITDMSRNQSFKVKKKTSDSKRTHCFPQENILSDWQHTQSQIWRPIRDLRKLAIDFFLVAVNSYSVYGMNFLRMQDYLYLFYGPIGQLQINTSATELRAAFGTLSYNFRTIYCRLNDILTTFVICSLDRR